MTAKLEALLAAADTEGGWHYREDDNGYHDVRSPQDHIVFMGENCYLPDEERANLQLAALAPALAQACIDAERALAEILHHIQTRRTSLHMDGTEMFSQPILAQLNGITREALASLRAAAGSDQP